MLQMTTVTGFLDVATFLNYRVFATKQTGKRSDTYATSTHIPVKLTIKM